MTSLAPGSSEITRSDAVSGAALSEHQEHDHGGHADARLFGLATFLVADGMTFAGFFAAYLTFRAVNPLPPGSNYELELVLPAINTLLLQIGRAHV